MRVACTVIGESSCSTWPNTEIASRMFISERTAKAHLSSAADKLNMGRVQMARLVERADLPARL